MEFLTIVEVLARQVQCSLFWMYLDGEDFKISPQHSGVVFCFVGLGLFFYNLAMQVSSILECDQIQNPCLRKMVQSSDFIIRRQEKWGSKSFIGSGLHLLFLYSGIV